MKLQAVGAPPEPKRLLLAQRRAEEPHRAL
jgi:hypothetical protein